MSWIKKRGQNTPSTVPQPQVQMYDPNQHHSNQETQWQQQQQPPQPQDSWYNQQANWQQQSYPQQNYNQQYGQYYQNNGGYQQQPQQEHHDYGNVQYNQQLNAQNNVYEPEPTTQNDWSTSWSWGDENNSNVQKQPSPQQPTQVSESFANDEAWNWSLDDQASKPESDVPIKNLPQIERISSNRNKLETPQWSMESQMSQESSDDLLQTSESDKSRMLSRSSTISHSPISGMENQIPETLSAAAAPAAASLTSENHSFENKEVLIAHTENKTKGRNISVNLETLPDNSEQPDLPPLQASARKITPPQWSENNEAPINDRNQYLETAQLSDIDTNNFNRPPESQEIDTLPPLGLRRVILGQIENNTNEPPEGLRRMIPGESSSPENALQRRDDVELTRSATIGADTPPVVLASTTNRSETTIGADAVESDSKRPEMIEGEGELINAVRNLTVDDNDGDDADVDITISQGVGGPGEGIHGKSSGESDRGEIRPKTPERRERRYRDRDRDREKEDRERGRGARYSPSDYREKKYDRKRYKDRRYEEDSDYYYSDKERRQKDDRDLDRKYSSLRKEKEKDKRRRDDRRDYGRDRRGGEHYYYGRYEDDYENESRSRASSRSDSMQDSYRDRDRGHERDRRDKRHREKDRHRRQRGDPFNPYQNFGYDMYSQYYQQYQYYENLRKTNPQAYAQLYRKYYQGDQTYASEDRASVHSGRSSANDELAKDRYTRQSYYSQTSLPQMGGYGRGSQAHSILGQYGLDESSYSRTFDQPDSSLNYEEQQQINPQRLTPAKFATAHIKASISSGKFVKILPHYPLDGQPATVELCTLENLLYNDEDYQELKRFPGPLVKGTTHKKTIIEYCESKIKNAKYNIEIDYESYVLMWELLILLIRQNGMVVGADIAELLLQNRHDVLQQRPPSSVSSIGSNVAATEIGTSAELLATNNLNLKEEEITKKFREYLLFGSVKEALEWAMKHGLWGHALFLASKLDKRTYANVLMRFANGLAINDPLQTLYQLLSGRTPAAVTCVADEKWGDWRPHLAMILSNSTQRPDLNCKAITLLGDTLMSRGSLFAAQFCYLMAEVNFGEYGNIESKLVLLGANHNEQFLKFATNEAIHMTEIYEYARSLNDEEFTLATFQRYKFILSTRLADVGLLEKALSYLEKIANFIVKYPSLVDGKLIDEVTHLADRLKYYDPIGDGSDYDDDYGTNRVDDLWLNNLRKVQNEVNMGLITSSGALNTLEDTTYQEQAIWQPQPTYEYQQQQPSQQINEQPAAAENSNINQYPPEQQYWQNAPQWSDQNYQTQQQQQHPEPTEQNYYSSVAQPEEILPPQQQPQISLPNHSKQQEVAGIAESEANLRQDGGVSKPKTNVEQEKQPISSGGGTGWFGGIFNKLSLKPKNQMKLPDDKNPTIVWDPEKKRWVNTDADGADSINDFKPPPKMLPKTQPLTMTPFAATGPTKNPEINGNNLATTNIFKLQRNRVLKKSYIDVFNPNAKQGAPQTSPPPPLEMMPPPAGPPPPSMNFFIPQPINDANAPTDFLTPAPPMQYDENLQMSRWSSASSLSREVQSYTMKNQKIRR